LKVLVDENLPPRMARSLQALFVEQHEVIALRDKFGRSGVPDLEWIGKLGEEGRWVILTADVRIAKNQVEKNAFLKNNLIGFVMAPALRKQKLTLQMARVLTAWDMFERQYELVSKGLFQFGIKGGRMTPL
jgi:predicted nuclease of predicted toxin-antitoxin system